MLLIMIQIMKSIRKQLQWVYHNWGKGWLENQCINHNLLRMRTTSIMIIMQKRIIRKVNFTLVFRLQHCLDNCQDNIFINQRNKKNVLICLLLCKRMWIVDWLLIMWVRRCLNPITIPKVGSRLFILHLLSSQIQTNRLIMI